MENQNQKATSVFLQKMEEEDVKLDRISALPDSIIRHILSFLPTSEEAIKTGVLSKRWDSLWASVPNLIFRHHEDGNIQDFFNFIDKTLILYSSSKIKKFVVDFGYQDPDDSLNSRIGLWLRFALIRDADELCLEFWKSQDEKSNDIYCYTLPYYFYNNSKLVKLKSRFCDYMPKGKVHWNSLKFLSITYAEFSDDAINKILQGSPVLECLELLKCSGLDNLDITSKSLKKLVVNGIWELGAQENVSMIEISAPNLQFLEILGNWYRRKCRLMNVSSLVSVSLKFELTVDKQESNDFRGEYGNMMKELLEKVDHVNELTLGNWCIQVLSISMSKGKLLRIRSSNHTYLILDTHFDEWDLHGLASLLLSSPKLEKLVIDMTSNIDKKFHMHPKLYNSYRFGGNYWTSKKLIFKYSLLHLKTIEIVVPKARNYWNEHLFQFLQFLLGNAKVLEKMVISDNCAQDQRKHELYEVAQKLLSFPRSSPHAVILLP